MTPQFPLYIPSKGRWEKRLTVRALETIGVPFRIVVEEQERERYAAVIDPAKILVLDPEYQRAYDARCELPEGASKGSGPARNFIWDHSMSEGHAWHWIMDDNIQRFMRLNRNLKVPVADGTVFRCMEDFVLRFRNIGMAGPTYDTFAPRKKAWPPYWLNTRVYSCNLIRNDIPFRWRCRYNEDTDLSLRILKAGWCTVLFNAFLQKKMATMSQKGGNTDELYKHGTEEKSRQLWREHPDVTKLISRFGRPHHYIDCSGFKNPLVLRPGATIPDGVDDYGMRLIMANQQAGGAAA